VQRRLPPPASGPAKREGRGLAPPPSPPHAPASERRRGEPAIRGGGGRFAGSSLVAAAPPQRGSDGGRLRDANDVERQSAIDLGLGVSLRHRVSPFPHAIFYRRLSIQYHSFSMRIICGFASTWPSRSMAVSALRIAASLV